MCNRVAMGMACDECGYPYSEALIDTDFSIPHDILCCSIHGYDFMDESCNCWKCEEQPSLK